MASAIDLVGVAGSYVWAYWLVALVVVGEAVVQLFTGFAPGSGWKGLAFYFGGALTVLVYGGAVIGWLLVHAPLWALKSGCVAACLALAILVLVVQPGESDGREGLPKSAPNPGG